MSLGDFTQWLNVASADGHISDEEADALLDKARQLGVDEAAARLLIEQKRQKFLVNPGTCPNCEHPLGEATAAMLCPNCKADLTAVRAKYKSGIGIQASVKELEDSLATLVGIHIPQSIKSKNFDHAFFAAAVSSAEKATSRLETLYGASPEIATKCADTRQRIAASQIQYQKAVKRGKYGIAVPAVCLLIVIGGWFGYTKYADSSKEQRHAELKAQFNRLLEQGKYDSAEAVYYTLRSEQVPAVFKDMVFVKDGDTSTIPEVYTWIMNGRFSQWSEPKFKRIQELVDAGSYDSVYVLLKVLQSEWRSYPTTNSKAGLYGEENTLQIIDDVVEVTENQMFDNELQKGNLAVALKIMSKVSSSSRRRLLLEHAYSYLTETNRLKEAEQIKVLLSN